MVELSGKTKAILLTAIILAALLLTLAGLQFIKTISSTGTIKAIGCEVYWDSGLINKITAINWGILEPGQSKDILIYIKNTGNAPSTLTLGTQNWNPAVTSDFIDLYWNYNNSTIPAGSAIPVTLTIAVSPTITGITNFSFDIVIIAIG